MQNSMKIFTKLVLTMVLVLNLTPIALAAEKENVSSTMKVGVVDSNKILQTYPKAQRLMQDIAKAEADLNKKILEKKQALDKAKSENKTQTELQMMAEQMRLEIEPEAKKIEADSNKRSDEIEGTIKAAIEKSAKEGKYDIVLIKEAVLYGGTDLSDSVLQTLGKQ